jgi:E3 ubiquitin-protein ligase RNF13
MIVSILFLSLNKYANATITVYDGKNISIIDYDDSSAAFGPRVPANGFKGYIVVASPYHGCSKLKSPPNVSFVDPSQWIALIKRTPKNFENCSFDVKVFNAQQAGFKAVIVYNSDSDNLITMSSSGQNTIKIPSVFVGFSSGNDLGAYYSYENNGSYVLITNDDTDLGYLLIPFVCVVSICFLIAVSIFVVKLALHCRKIRKNRFPRSALKKIPTKKYQKTDKYDTCPICLNEYEEGVKIRILPCEHAYHIECIDKWLLRNNRCCPVCKRRVLPGDPESESSDADSDSGHRPTSTQMVVQEQHEPNDDDETNESSRLLVNADNNEHHQETKDDHMSIGTVTSSNLLSNKEFESNSMNGGNVPSHKMTSSSKYGSISSINQLNNNNNNNNNNTNFNNSITNQAYLPDSNTENDIASEEKLKKQNLMIDSKSSPEFHTPLMNSSSLTLENVQTNSKSTKKKNADKLKKSGANPPSDGVPAGSADVNIHTSRVFQADSVHDKEEELETFASCKEDFNMLNNLENVHVVGQSSGSSEGDRGHSLSKIV